MKAKDIRLLIFISAVLFSLLLIHIISGDKAGSIVRITENGSVIGEYPLYENRTIELSHNTISIKDNSVSVTEADCPDGLCMRQGSISHLGEVIACLPNRVTVEVISKDHDRPGLPISYSGIHFDTMVNVTIYGISDTGSSGAVSSGDHGSASIPDNGSSDSGYYNDFIRRECEKYELICSRTNPDSELYMLNHRLINDKIGIVHEGQDLTAYKISSELYEMIEAGLRANDLSGGKFDIAIAPLSDLWDFRSGDSVIPSDDEIASVLPHLSPDDIILVDDQRIAFADDRCMIDLGALAKGYIGDRLRDSLSEAGVTNAIIALGGNVVAMGDKNGAPYEVGIRKPFSQSGELSATVAAQDMSVVTSGTYERFFESDGRRYHHILDPRTGYPYETDLASATVICGSSTDGDILSTILLTEGSGAAIEHAHELENEDIYVILMDNEGHVLLNTYPD